MSGWGLLHFGAKIIGHKRLQRRSPILTAPIQYTPPNARLTATSGKTFKLFAPAWRGVGGDANVSNMKNFTEIFGNTAPANIRGTVAGTRFFNYTLGPYVVQPYVRCALLPDSWSYKNPNTCGKTALDDSAIARGVSDSNYAVYADNFANILVVPNDPKTLEFMRSEAVGQTTGGNAGFTGLFSDSMGLAPIQTDYANDKPWKPGTSPRRTYTAKEWLDAQNQMLATKKAALGSGKVHIINGLANGDTYFKTDGSKGLITASIDGAMAERIFREPHSAMGTWDSPVSWKRDVDMIVDVENQGKYGYWWSKCWSQQEGGSNCQDDANASEGIKQVRRFTMASFMLGAGNKSYFNFDTKIDDGNAAEWFANDYSKAQGLGLATGNYVQIGSTGVYKRDFANGMVVVNPEGSAKTISVGNYTDLDGNAKSGSISVPAHTGSILTKSGSAGDTAPPTVSLTSPSAGATVAGSINVMGSAADNVGVTNVELLIDGAVKGSDTSAPNISIAWNSTSVGDGTHRMAFKAYDAAGNVGTTSEITVTVRNTGPPPAPVITSFTADPTSVVTGSRSMLRWSTTSTKSCSVNPGGPQNVTTTSWQTAALSPVGTKSFELDCVNTTGAHVKKSLSIAVTPSVAPPDKPTLTSSATVVERGGSVTLSWSSRGATTCRLSPGNITASGFEGSRVVSNITANTTFSVNCSNSAGSSTSDGVLVTVTDTPPPPAAPQITKLTATPDRVGTGGRSTIEWASSNVRSGGCKLAPSPLGAVNGNGSWLTPELSTSISYTLTCVNSIGTIVSRSVSVVVDGIAPPPAPAPVAPNPAGNNEDKPIVHDDKTNQDVTNTEEVTTAGGLITLDSANITDPERIASIDYVEYYINDKLVQRVDNPPYALDSTKLENGRYTITERTYFLDGSVSEVTRTIDIKNDKPEVLTQLPWWRHWQWWLGALILTLLGAAAYFFRNWWLPVVLRRKRDNIESDMPGLMTEPTQSQSFGSNSLPSVSVDKVDESNTWPAVSTQAADTSTQVPVDNVELTHTQPSDQPVVANTWPPAQSTPFNGTNQSPLSGPSLPQNQPPADQANNKPKYLASDTPKCLSKTFRV